MNQTQFILRPAPSPARANCSKFIWSAPNDWVVTVKPPTRSLEQNAKMWAMLAEVSIQVDWYGEHLTSDQWKNVFTASLKGQKVVPSIDGGGFVTCGYPTSNMSKAEMVAMIDLMYAFGSDPAHLVNFNDMANIESMGRPA